MPRRDVPATSSHRDLLIFETLMTLRGSNSNFSVNVTISRMAENCMSSKYMFFRFLYCKYREKMRKYQEKCEK